MILPADKGSAIVILNKTDYIAEANRQLSDTTTYKPLSSNPTSQYNDTIKHFLEVNGPREGLTNTEIKLLTPTNPRTSQLYLLPKIHKQNNPGRPIISSYNSPTERISAFVDHYLQPFVRNLPTHIKDTNHFLDTLKEIPQPLPEGTLLVTVDVVSLYTNITHVMGLKAIEHYLNQRPTPCQPTTHFLRSLTEFVLTKNNFQFLDKNYLQIQGTAMGTRAAPSYANLAMGLLETDFSKTQNLKPILTKRFIEKKKNSKKT